MIRLIAVHSIKYNFSATT